MSKVPHISELAEPPVIGKRYLVPCIRFIVDVQGHHVVSRWAPVRLPGHCDPELGFALHHYHVDWRFASGKMVDAWLGIVVCSSGYYAYALHSRPISNGILGAPEDRVMTCKRVVPEFPDGLCRKLEPLYKDATLLPGLRCPHRGVCLASEPVKTDGTVICPGHGLCWDVATGQLVSRLPKPSSDAGNRAGRTRGE